MRKLLWLILVFLININNSVIAQEYLLKAEIVKYRIFINDYEANIDNPMLSLNDRTYLPLRELAELLNLYVYWDDENKTVEISDIGVISSVNYNNLSDYDNESIIDVNIVDFKIRLNGYIRTISNPSISFKDRVYLPVRDISEMLQCSVNWVESEQTIKINRTAVSFENNILYPFEVNGLYGYADENGNMLIEPKYTVALPFSEGLAAVCDENYKFGYIDISGDLIIPHQYSYAGYFSEGMASVSLQEIYLDKSDSQEHINWVLFSEPRDSYSYIDKTGSIKTETNYKSAGTFHNGLAQVILPNNKYAYINKTGQTKYESDDLIYDFNDGFAVIETETKQYIIDTEFNIVFDGSKYQSLDFNDGFIIAKKNDKYGVLDLSENVIIEFKYDTLSQFSEGLFAFRLGSNHGYIDINDNVIIDSEFEMTDIFINGKALVVFSETPESMFFINKCGEIVSDSITYCYYNRTDDGLTMIYPENNGYYINLQGKPMKQQQP